MKLHKIKLKSNSGPAFRILIKTEIIESQFKSFSENIFRTQVSIYDGGFCEYTQRLTIFAIKAP